MLNKGILLAGKEKLYNIIRGSVSHVSLSYSPQTDIKAGTRVNITVNANSGYQNPSVSVTKNDGTGSVTVSGSGSSRYFTMPKSDVTINASASLIPTYSVSGSASGGGISFSKTSGIRAGETVTVYLSPNSYYVLSSLTSSPSVSFSGSGNTRTFKMPSSNVRVTATFVAWNLAITVGDHYYNGRHHYLGYSNANGTGRIQYHNGSDYLPYQANIRSLFTWWDDNSNSVRGHDYMTSRFEDEQDIAITRLDNGKHYFCFDNSSVSHMINSNKWGDITRNPLFTKADIGKTIYFYAWKWGLQPW